MQKINGPKSTTGTETASRRNIKGKAIRSLNLAREMLQRREDLWSLCSGLLGKTDQRFFNGKSKAYGVTSEYKNLLWEGELKVRLGTILVVGSKY